MPERIAGAWSFTEAINPNALPKQSQKTPATNIRKSGSEPEASTSTVVGEADGHSIGVGAEVKGAETLMAGTEGVYSNWLGFSGAFAIGTVAFSKRANRFERIAAEVPSFNCISVARAIGRRVIPLV